MKIKFRKKNLPVEITPFILQEKKKDNFSK